MRLGQKPLQLGILSFKILEPSCLGHAHPAVLRTSFVEARVAKAVLSAQLLQQHTRFNLLDETNDLLFRVFALSHRRHSPELTDASEISSVRYDGSRSRRLQRQIAGSPDKRT
jgi:hypothetical protein